MRRGFTRIEAEALVNQLFETQETLGSVPRRTRGRVIEALDAIDHWNVLIEWDLPRFSPQVWYDKYDVQHSLRPVQSLSGRNAVEGEMQAIEIRSSHDLATKSADARKTGAHSYQVDYRHFTSMFHAREKDKTLRAGPLGLKTLSPEHIWITEGESRRVLAAIQATLSLVVLF